MTECAPRPASAGDGPPVKDLEAARRSYLFLTDVTEATVDRAIAAARASTSGHPRCRPYVTPVPDPRLYHDRRTALAEAIDEKASTLRAAAPVSDWPGGTERRSYEGKEADHRELIIGEEIVR